MKISIGLCTYNSAKYLQEQLDSYLQQTRLPDELVVCDNDSQDSTIEILEKFKSTAPFPVRIERNGRNLGFNKNFEKATSLCSGDLIFLSDSDDFWLPEKLAIMEEAFADSADAVLGFSNEHIGDDQLRYLNQDFWTANGFTLAECEELLGSEGFRVLARKTVATGHSLAFRAELKDKLLPFPEDYMYDAWIFWIASQCGRIFAVEEPLVVYRTHGAQNVGLLSSDPFTRLAQRFRRSARLKREAYAGIARESRYVLDRLKKINVARPEVIDLLLERENFFLKKSNYPELRALRLFPIFSHLVHGCYQRFENGFASAVKDLLAR